MNRPGTTPVRPRPSRRRPSRRRGALAVSSAAALLLLTGCGSGQKAQTYLEKATAEATNDVIGALSVRALAVLPPEDGISYPAGGDAPLSMIVVNEGAERDVLLDATTDAAADVVVAAGPSSQFVVEPLQTSDLSYEFELQGLTRPLMTAEYIELTLSFERNGTKTFMVPVATTNEQVAAGDTTYQVAETDSEGEPIPPEEARPETDTDGGEAPQGDAAPEGDTDPRGDVTQDPPVSE